jgi:carboxypeptidase family protein
MRARFLYPFVLLAVTAAGGPPGINVVDKDGNPIRAELRLEDGKLVVEASGFLPWSGSLPPDAEGPVKVVLKRSALVRGRVVVDGVGLAGAHMIIRRAGKGGRELAAATSDSRGIFELKGLPPSALRLAVSADGVVPLERPVSLGEGETRWIQLEPHRTATLRVRVTGPNGQPVAEAEAQVRIEGPDGRYFSEVGLERLAGLRGTSDRDGRLTLDPVERGVPHRIVFRRGGFAPRSILVTPEVEVVERQVRLQRAGEIRLTLRDLKERPVGGAVAEPMSDDAPDVDLLDVPEPSDPDGILRMRGLPGGTYVLRVRAPGLRPVTVRDVAVRAGQTSDAGVITLEPGSSVAGRVVDESGAPLRGAGVGARFYQEGRRLTVGAESDGEGRFLLSGLSDGDAEIQVEARGFFPKTLGAVRPGSQDLRVVLSRPGRIIGRAIDARGGAPIPIFSIDLAAQGEDGRVRGERWRTEETRTDFDDPEGRFEVMGLRPQRYTLVVKAQGYSPSGRVEVEARASSPESITLTLDGGRALEGVVLDAENSAPVESAVVRSEEGDAVLTDAEGRFRVDGIDGRTDLRVEHSLYVTKVLGTIDREAAGPLEIRLARGGSVEGIVYGRGGVPVQGAEVRLQEDGRVVLADADGHYRLDGVPPGERVLRKVEVPGSFEGTESALVTVRQGETSIRDFGRGVRLYGVVTSRGVPASGAVITVGPSGEGAIAALAVDDPAVMIRAREDGFYEARGLQPGTYGLTLMWEGRTVVGHRATLEQGASEQRLDLQIPDLWLGGTVIDPNTGAGLRGIVSVASLEGSGDGLSGFVGGDDGEMIPYSSFPEVQVESDEIGRFRVPLMDPGTYAVSASAEGYTMERPLELRVETSRSDLRLELKPAITLVVKATDAETGASLKPDCVSFFGGLERTCTCGAEPRLDSLRPDDGLASAFVSGYAPGYRKVSLRDDRHEVAVSLTRGGTLRLLLPPQVESVEAARSRYRLRIENSDGIDILLAGLFDLAREGDPAIRHVPAEPLRVRIGGENSGIPEKRAEVIVSEDGEAVADLR